MGASAAAEFAAVLRRAREALGITQEALAWDLGTSPARVSAWESGRCLPRLHQLPRLARALGVDLPVALPGGLVVAFAVRPPA